MRSPGSSDPEITIQANVDIPSSITRESITSLVRHVLGAEGVMGEWQMGIQFVDDQTMQLAHVEFMDIDTPTDIMTFPYDDGDDEFDIPPFGEWAHSKAGGDLIISVDRAADHALDEGWSVDQELLFLVLHGVLHLLGWDDASEEDRNAMLERQSLLLREWSGYPGARR